MSTTRIAPVGSVLPSSASATSLVRVSAMMPEPTTVATKQRGAERFGGEPARQIEFGHQLAFSWPEVEPSMRPISRNRVPSDSRSMLSSGRLVKAAMRFLR